MTTTLPVPRDDKNAGDRPRETEGRMTFTEHLSELRGRILWAAGSLMLGFLVCYAFSDQIFQVLQRPVSSININVAKGKEAIGAPKTSLPLKLVSAIAEPAPLAIIESTEKGTRGTYTLGDTVLEGVTIQYIDEGFVVLQIEDHFEILGAKDQKSDAAENDGSSMTILSPLEPVFVKLKLAGYGGVALALPMIIYQICGFIFPGLTHRERKAVKIFVSGGAVLGILGLSIAYFAIFPLVLPYLMNWVPKGVEIQLRMNETLSIIIKGLLAFALAFQFPMVVLVLVFLGLLTPAILKKYRKVAIIGLAVMAAFFTPPDPFSMLIMLVPLYLLYEASIWASYFVIRSKEKAAGEGA